MISAHGRVVCASQETNRAAAAPAPSLGHRHRVALGAVRQHDRLPGLQAAGQIRSGLRTRIEDVRERRHDPGQHDPRVGSGCGLLRDHFRQPFLPAISSVLRGLTCTSPPIRRNRAHIA